MRRRAFGLRPVPSLPSKPFGFNPSRLRASLASRGSAQGPSPPRSAWRPSIPSNRLAPDRQSQHPAAIGRAWRIRRGLLRQVVRMRVFLNAGGSCPSRHEERFTNTPPSLAMEFPHHASRPAPLSEVVTLSPVVGSLTWPASGNAPLKPPCGDAELSMSPFGGRFGPRRPWLVVNPGGGTAAPRASWLQPSGTNNFPAAARLPRGTNSLRLPVLHCVATASGAARPSPAGRITTRTRWARTLFN